MTISRPWTASGKNGIGGAGITLAIVDSSSGAAADGGHEPGDRLGGRRQDEHPADDPGERLEAVPEPGDHAEVAAAAADRPEQVGLRLGVGPDQPAVGRHDLGGEERVDRQPVLAHEIADAAAEGDPTDADGARVAEPDGEPVRGEGGRQLAGRETRSGPGGPAGNVDVEIRQAAQVEQDPAVRRAVAGPAVAAAPDGQLEPGLAGQVDDIGDVAGVRGADDDRRPPVEPADEDGTGRVVPGIVGGDEPVAEVGPQPVEGKGGTGGLHGTLLAGGAPRTLRPRDGSVGRRSSGPLSPRSGVDRLALLDVRRIIKQTVGLLFDRKRWLERSTRRSTPFAATRSSMRRSA